MKWIFSIVFGYFFIGFCFGSIAGEPGWLIAWPLGLWMIVKDTFQDRRRRRRRS